MSRATAQQVIVALTAAGLTVATAESLTGGLLAATLTEVPGSSAVVRGGLVVYATDLKHSLAGVNATLLAARGPVDPEVAVALAQGARRRCGADVGVGLTGVAGPADQDGHPPGTWYVAVASAVGTALREGRPDAEAGEERGDPVRSRGRIRGAAVDAALDLLMGAARAGRGTPGLLDTLDE